MVEESFFSVVPIATTIREYILHVFMLTVKGQGKLVVSIPNTSWMFGYMEATNMSWSLNVTTTKLLDNNVIHGTSLYPRILVQHGEERVCGGFFCMSDVICLTALLQE